MTMKMLFIRRFNMEKLLHDIDDILATKYDKFTADLLSFYIGHYYLKNDWFISKELKNQLTELKDDLLKRDNKLGVSE